MGSAAPAIEPPRPHLGYRGIAEYCERLFKSGDDGKACLEARALWDTDVAADPVLPLIRRTSLIVLTRQLIAHDEQHRLAFSRLSDRFESSFAKTKSHWDFQAWVLLNSALSRDAHTVQWLKDHRSDLSFTTLIQESQFELEAALRQTGNLEMLCFVFQDPRSFVEQQSALFRGSLRSRLESVPSKYTSVVIDFVYEFAAKLAAYYNSLVLNGFGEKAQVFCRHLSEWCNLPIVWAAMLNWRDQDDAAMNGLVECLRCEGDGRLSGALLDAMRCLNIDLDLDMIRSLIR